MVLCDESHFGVPTDNLYLKSKIIKHIVVIGKIKYKINVLIVKIILQTQNVTFLIAKN